jgi:hypothetical protein
VGVARPRHGVPARGSRPCAIEVKLGGCNDPTV